MPLSSVPTTPILAILRIANGEEGNYLDAIAALASATYNNAEVSRGN